MARSFSNLSNSITSNLEIRIERLERTCNGLEARLINLTTLIRSQVTKVEPAGENSFEKFMSRLKRLESNHEPPLEKIESMEKRLLKLEKSFTDSSYRKHFEETQEKIRDCLKDLKDNLKAKEKEFCEKFENQLRALKEDFSIISAKEKQKVKGKDGADEIDNIIQELQERINKKKPTQKRSESFSGIGIRSKSPKYSEKKMKGKISARRTKRNN